MEKLSTVVAWSRIIGYALIVLALIFTIGTIFRVAYDLTFGDHQDITILAYDANCAICGTTLITSIGADARQPGIAGPKKWEGFLVRLDGVIYSVDDFSPAAERSPSPLIELRLPTHREAVIWGNVSRKFSVDSGFIAIED